MPLPQSQHVWYADDATAIGKQKDNLSWWDKLSSVGPGLRYYTNAIKTWLIAKEQHLVNAKLTFSNTRVNITAVGRPYLGSPIGSDEYINQNIAKKVDKWNEELLLLSKIAIALPHATFTNGYLAKKNKKTFEPQ